MTLKLPAPAQPGCAFVRLVNLASVWPGAGPLTLLKGRAGNVARRLGRRRPARAFKFKLPPRSIRVPGCRRNVLRPAACPLTRSRIALPSGSKAPGPGPGRSPGETPSPSPSRVGTLKPARRDWTVPVPVPVPCHLSACDRDAGRLARRRRRAHPTRAAESPAGRVYTRRRARPSADHSVSAEFIGGGPGPAQGAPLTSESANPLRRWPFHPSLRCSVGGLGLGASS